MLPEDVAATIIGQQSVNPRAAVEMMEDTEGVDLPGTEEIDGRLHLRRPGGRHRHHERLRRDVRG
jgi:hypothetical protein